MTEIQSLVDLIGHRHVNHNDDLCRRFSEDIAGPAPYPVSTVVRPADADMVATVVAWANLNHKAVLVRGGGMSYTSGYLPERAGSLMLDMTAMQSVSATQPARNSVCVGAGCTWSSLYDTLAAENRRTPFFGPLSGKVATIGGAVAQNSAFFGSARYGTAQDQVQGIELVDGRGQLQWVGEDDSGQLHYSDNLNEDWPQLLVGDAGVFGVKTRIVLRTMPLPQETSFFSFAFAKAQHVIQCMAALNKITQLADIYAFDRQTHQHLSRSGFSVLEAPQLARDLVTQSGSLLKTAGTLIQGAALSKVRLADYAWSLHMVLELNDRETSLPLDDEISSICLSHCGKQIPDTIPRVTRARPFRSIRALVGPDGERWLPCHGVFQAAHAEAVMRKLEEWLTAQSSELQKHDIRVTTLLARVGPNVIIEPQFYWPDNLSGFQQHHARPEQIRQFANKPAMPLARERVRQLRDEIRDLFTAEGAGFMQLGKYYPWPHKLGGVTAARARELKRQMDPNNILNPGALRF